MKKTLVLVAALIAIILAVCVIVFLSADRGPFTGPDSSVRADGEDEQLGEGYQRYVHPSFRFTLDVPEAMEIRSHQEKGGAETVTFEMSGDPSQDFQLYIIPYSEETITSSQIAKDTNGSTIGTPQEVMLGSGIRGIIFESEHPVMGRLREVWFLMNGHLIEVTTYAGNDEWIASVLETLKPNTF